MSCREKVLELLTYAGNKGIAGGRLEDTIRELYGYKASNVSRRARELFREGKIQRAELNGFVYYRIKYDR